GGDRARRREAQRAYDADLVDLARRRPAERRTAHPRGRALRHDRAALLAHELRIAQTLGDLGGGDLRVDDGGADRHGACEGAAPDLVEAEDERRRLEQAPLEVERGDGGAHPAASGTPTKLSASATVPKCDSGQVRSTTRPTILSSGTKPPPGCVL